MLHFQYSDLAHHAQAVAPIPVPNVPQRSFVVRTAAGQTLEVCRPGHHMHTVSLYALHRLSTARSDHLLC